MNCPQCGSKAFEAYKGEQAHKLNTGMCPVCGRVPVATSKSDGDTADDASAGKAPESKPAK